MFLLNRWVGKHHRSVRLPRNFSHYNHVTIRGEQIEKGEGSRCNELFQPTCMNDDASDDHSDGIATHDNANFKKVKSL